jgi:GST-like protein
MIDLYYWTSANAQKILLFLEELSLPFNIVPVNVGAGEQYLPEFVKVSPNSKIPVIVDHEPEGGGDPIVIFESGAILLYLAEKTGHFLATDTRTRFATLQWLFWQVGGLGPIGGQAVHFRNFAPEPIEYALKRYGNENLRLIGVLDRQLQDRDFIVGEYSIADMACYPWIVAHDRRKQLDFEPFPNLTRWFESIRARPATERAYEWPTRILGGPLPKGQADLTPEQRKILFGG